MKIENQVCTLEQAKLLKLLAVGNERAATYFVYIPEIKSDNSIDREKATLMTDADAWGNVWSSLYDRERLPAFTVSELGQMLPAEFGTYYSEHNGGWNWQATEPTDVADGTTQQEQPGWAVTHQGDGEFDSEAEARADALIYCIEKNILSVDDANERLKVL